MKIIKYEKKTYSSTPISVISADLIKKHKPEIINRGKKNIRSRPEKLSCGEISFSEKCEEINLYSKKTNLEILNCYNSISLSRAEFQFFLAIFDIFITEYNKTKDLEQPIFMTIKDFHNQVLNIKNRIRKEDIVKYINIFDGLSNKLITIDTTKVINKKRKKLFIHGPIANITIISIPEDDFYGLKIFPTGYIQFECINTRHISNYLPRKFIQLDLRENDNILFFGYHIVRIHKLNNKNKNKELIFTWKSSVIKVINSALPDAITFFENYNKNKYQKSQYLNRNIILPLKKSLEILKTQNYILEFSFINLKTRNIFNESQKLVIIFNYDKSKFKEN